MTFENLKVEKIKTIVSYKPDIVTWKAVSRKDHIIGINIDGTTYHDLGYKHMNIEPNFIYFFNQKDNFSACVKEFGYCYSVHFTTYEPIETESFCKKVNNLDELRKIIEKIEKAWLIKEHGELNMLSNFYNLCDIIYKLYNAPYTPKDDRIISAKKYIDLNFKKKECLEQAVNVSGVSRRRFNDIFKLQFNITPNRYIISKKIEYAKEILNLGYLSLGEIADMCGFSDIYYFSKVFKNETGITPGQYKRKIK